MDETSPCHRAASLDLMGPEQRHEVVAALNAIRSLAAVDSDPQPLVVQPLRMRVSLKALLSRAALRREYIATGWPGAPLTLTLRLLDAHVGGLPIANAAVYLWHGDRHGAWIAERGSALVDTHVSRLRGVQLSDAAGCVRFRTIYPGADADGNTRIHVQVLLIDRLHVTAAATASIVVPPAPDAAAPPPGDTAWPTLPLRTLHGDPAHGYEGTLSVALTRPSEPPFPEPTLEPR